MGSVVADHTTPHTRKSLYYCDFVSISRVIRLQDFLRLFLPEPTSGRDSLVKFGVAGPYAL